MSPIKALKLFLITFSIIFTNNLIAQTVYVTNTGEKYHVVNCRYLKYSQNETTIKKAKDLGYLACKVCKPTVENTPKIKTEHESNVQNEKATSIKKVIATQCTGNTKSGRRCLRKTKNSNGRCYQH